MEIYVTSGTGTGKTLLSAFDSALENAKVSNYNLLYISSIIPPKSKIVLKKFKSHWSEYGNKLYVVKAEIRSKLKNQYIGAALGWYQTEDGRGVFVEHELTGDTKDSVRDNLINQVTNSLIDLCKQRRFIYNRDKLHHKISICKVKKDPTSTIVLAVYKSENWS